MDWGKITIIGLCCGLGWACGPEGSAAPDTDSEGESEDTGTGSTGGDASATNPTATNPTAGSMSGSATTTEGTTAGSGPADSSGDMTDTMPTAETGDCPPGTEGCPCDVGAACDEGLSCDVETGTCVGQPACRPIDTDPHDDEATAIGLDEIGCDQGMDLGLIGTIEGPQTDWYTFFGNDSFGCIEQPGALVMADEMLRVCVFLECNNGDVDAVECGAKSMDGTSPEGRAGCCGMGGALVEDYDCTGFGSNKDVDVYVSVGSDERVCVDYEMAYGF